VGMNHLFTNKANNLKPGSRDDELNASIDMTTKQPSERVKFVSLFGKSPRKYYSRVATAQTVSSRQKIVETLNASRTNLNSASKSREAFDYRGSLDNGVGTFRNKDLYATTNSYNQKRSAAQE
jgi:hypothetical protein